MFLGIHFKTVGADGEDSKCRFNAQMAHYGGQGYENRGRGLGQSKYRAILIVFLYKNCLEKSDFKQ